MTKEQQQVRQFHEAFGIHIEDKPADYLLLGGGYTAKQILKLRLRLMQEELAEVQAELICGTIEGLAKELADLLYVVYGTAVSYGIDMEAVFAEVHRSNMTKINGHKDKYGKWVKPDDYEPADIRSVINEQLV